MRVPIENLRNSIFLVFRHVYIVVRYTQTYEVTHRYKYSPMARMLQYCPRGCRNAFSLRLFAAYNAEKVANGLRISLKR